MKAFSNSAHDDMSQTHAYLIEDAGAHKCPNVCAATKTETMDFLVADAARFKKTYFADVQNIFSRVQHYMHKRTKKGYIPLKTCQRKCGKKCSMTCKSDFPRTRLRTHKSMLACRGVARKYKLKLSGRRNGFGSILGRRKCEWQSGTTPAFAVAFRSNTHTLPNWRIPPLPECHADDVCKSKTCQAMLGNCRDVKIASKLAQRVQRQCTGYYCGYSFKPQPVGRKYWGGAAESLSYLNTGMKDKSVGQRWHRITHRVLVDFQHRCMRRPAPEE